MMLQYQNNPWQYPCQLAPTGPTLNEPNGALPEKGAPEIPESVTKESPPQMSPPLTDDEYWWMLLL